jgi:diguanylate cyclase (GGDEF)-like protein
MRRGGAWYVCGPGNDFCTVHADDDGGYGQRVRDPSQGSRVHVEKTTRRNVALSGSRRFSATRSRRLVRRFSDDVHLVLALALVVPVLVAEALIGDTRLGFLVLTGSTFVATQATLGIIGRRLSRSSWRAAWPSIRLILAIVFVGTANGLVGDGPVRPAAALLVLVIALASAIGRNEGILIGTLGVVAYLGVLSSDISHVVTSLPRGAVLASAAIVLGIGTRRTMSTLESAYTRLRASMAGERRRARQIASVEAIGRLLASDGPTTTVLDAMMDMLVSRFGYTYVSVYVADGHLLRLGAQRGYTDPIVEFDGRVGVMGRVIRSGQPVFLPDTRNDPDFRAAVAGLSGEICVPLIAGGDLLGVINIESMGPGELDARDLETVTLIASRVASAMAIARQRDELATRADLFTRLATFSAVVNSTLDAAALHSSLVEAAAAVIPSDTVVLTVLDRATGEYRIAAIEGGDKAAIGAQIHPGEGMSGRAIRDRVVVAADRFERAQFPSALALAVLAEEVSVAAVPLLRDNVVVGALAIARKGTARPYTGPELAILAILGHHAALAVSNAFLHADVIESSLRDPLTGLFNRRFLDETFERLSAERSRVDPSARPQMAAILFDLDQFGAFNKEHGHRVGDNVLRSFAAVLRRRMRKGDLVARYGGEEFFVLLPGTGRESASRIAEEIRLEFRTMSIAGSGGDALGATVSAGCTELQSTQWDFGILVEMADVGLAMAKLGGRDQVVAA